VRVECMHADERQGRPPRKGWGPVCWLAVWVGAGVGVEVFVERDTNLDSRPESRKCLDTDLERRSELPGRLHQL
jgi:hypothetical protein